MTLQPGNYLLTVDPTIIADLAGNHLADPFELHFTKRPPNTPLVLNATTAGELFAADEEEIYTFTGSVGQRLFFDGLQGDYPLYFRLSSPSGVVLEDYNYVRDDLAPFTLIENGTYRLSVFAYYDLPVTPFPFAFRLLNASDQPMLTLDTPVGMGLTVVPANALTNLVGSYVDADLVGTAADDWRVSQIIAGSRDDSQINFTDAGWGERSPLNLTGGTDDDWDNFSVQWDGLVTVTQTDTHLYLRSAAGGRLWVDANRDGNFDDETELVDDCFDCYGTRLTLASPTLQPSAEPYAIRVQMHAGPYYTENTAELLWNGEPNLTPGNSADVFRFHGNAGQRLYFDQQFLHPGNYWRGNWTLYGPSNQAIVSTGMNYDMETTLPGDGEYLLALSGYYADVPVAYQFEVVTPDTTSTPLSYNSTVSGSINEPGEIDEYTFVGAVGQRILLDTLSTDYTSRYWQLVTPSGGLLSQAQAYGDGGPWTLTEAGTYRLRIRDYSDATGSYKFRLLNAADQPALMLDQKYGNRADTGSR